ncbi:MAG TPA: BlaI/MecI/CopY family transcriptional regulator [Candidatus Saccharimonadales bacterium]|nr:BlaI/MecI/CopY family transcriptional regulator [Candidatus Saccharimonadales bacterium]
MTTLELQIMEILWGHGPMPVRAVQERIPGAKRPAYTTVQTVMYRLEAKKALRRTSKTGNAHIFEPTVTRASAHKRLIDEFIALLGGSIQPVMAHLVDAGRLTLDDVQKAEARLRDLQKKRARK